MAASSSSARERDGSSRTRESDRGSRTRESGVSSPLWIPPPVVAGVASISLPTKREPTAADVEAQIQHLLDEQVECLTAPTATHDIRDIRTHICDAMATLVRIKETQITQLGRSREADAASLTYIDGFLAQRETLGEEERNLELESVQDEERMGKLHSHAANLQTQIDDMEEVLARLKADHAQAVDEIKCIRNALRTRNDTVQRQRQTLERNIHTYVQRQASASGKKLRSLEALRAATARSRDVSHGAREEAKFESDALQEGVKFWEQTVNSLQTFERAVASAINSGTNMDALFEDMIGELEERMETVKEKGWNLMICAIGAELEAVRTGRKLLPVSASLLDDPPSRLVRSRSNSTDDELVFSRH
ncbi:hypothetical protein K470DRAFT_273372 [Piedraia hortae CBS 480.64]|uniref:Uncharacterized protein n=1 Tax=Piedraia hortae CBS 480.64 TaxID=1314780 RepID=A0A6A7BS34_9PEZI|nr:hypothetical protein K470DRAFT_273372 [Piedraia hortae CBS 480.64]